MSTILRAGLGIDTPLSRSSHAPPNTAPRVANFSSDFRIPFQRNSSHDPSLQLPSPSRESSLPRTSPSNDTGVPCREPLRSHAGTSEAHISSTQDGSDLHRVLVDARGTPTSLLGRQGTLISASAPPARKSADLDTLLGGTHSKLRSGATYMSPPGDINASMFPGVSGPRSIPIALERAKVRAQVEVDLALTGDSFVQGQRMIGNFIVRVRKDPKKKDESTVLLADAKLRVIGFECLADDQHRHIFFQHTCRLDELSYSSEQIFEGAIEEGDAEGYRKGRPGLHVLPFEMELPAEVRGGNAKGAVEVHGGIAVRYVVLASIKVKDADTFKRSLAHFYRSCTIWPLLSFRLLVPAPRPLVSTAVGSLFLGCKHPCNKLKLTARIPRLWYLSGQRCYTHLRVENHTAGVVRSATVTLIRTTTVYKPCDGCQPLDERSYQMHTYSRAVAENHLELGKRGTKGHASAKGWWTGVGADQEMEFMHYIQLPPDALSISRSELLAVDYSLRVTVSASNTPGLTTDLSVVLPIRIASMVSVDPPPSFTIPNEALVINQYTKAFDTPHYGGKEMGTLPPYRTQPSSPELPGSRRFPKTKNLDLKNQGTHTYSEQPPYYTPHAPNTTLPPSDWAGNVKSGIALLVANPSTPSTVATPTAGTTKLRITPGEPFLSGLLDSVTHGQSTRNDEDASPNRTIAIMTRSPANVSFVSNISSTASSARQNEDGDEDGDSGFDGGAGDRVLVGHLNGGGICLSPLSLHRARARAQDMSTRHEQDAENKRMVPDDDHLKSRCVEDVTSSPIFNRRSDHSALENESSFARRVREKLARLATDGTGLGVVLPKESSYIGDASSDPDADQAQLPQSLDVTFSQHAKAGSQDAVESDDVTSLDDLDLLSTPHGPGSGEISLGARKLPTTRPLGGRPLPTLSVSRNRPRPHATAVHRTSGRETQSSPGPSVAGTKAYLLSRDPTPKTPRLEVQMPRRPKAASSKPGSVMDRVMMLEEKARALE